MNNDEKKISEQEEKTIAFQISKNKSEFHKELDKREEDFTSSSIYKVKSSAKTLMKNPLVIFSIALVVLMLVAAIILLGGCESRIDIPDVTVTDESEIPTVSEGEKLYIVKNSAEVKQIGGGISADYAVVVDLLELCAIAEKNSDKLMFPASMTKIMTFVTAWDYIQEHSDRRSLDDYTTITREVKNQYYGASRVGLDVGDMMTVEQLMYAMLLVSDTDATITLANYIAGSESEFAELMNAKAAELGLVNTHFANASGFHDNNTYTTAREMASIFAYALDIELFKEIVTCREYAAYLKYYNDDGELKSYRFIFKNSTIIDRFDNFNISTSLSNGMEILGGKTGFTDEAAYCQAVYSVNAEGKGYIAIIGHASTKQGCSNDVVAACLNFIG